MATGITSWSQTAATNASADSTINFAEGQLPPTVNNSARALMAIVKKYADDLSGSSPSNGVLLVAGTASAYTLASNISAGSLINGWTVTFRIDSSLSNAASVTLNVDSTGAKQLRAVTGTALPAGFLKVGAVYTATYFQPLDQWILHNSYGRQFSISFIIDGGGSAITSGIKGDLVIPVSCTILNWTILGDQSGSIVVDVWADSYANFPPTVADSIAGSEKPTISTATKGQDLSLSTWTTAVAAGDVLRFNVDSITSITRATLSITAVTTV